MSSTLIQAMVKHRVILKDYPVPGVYFITVDAFLSEPHLRQTIANLIGKETERLSFDAVAPIASRGYLFSNMLIERKQDLKKLLIQKVKAKDDRYVQFGTKTEYSKDALQILKGSILPGTRYLIVDDLIATGGSIETSVELIRHEGGIVDAAIVLTELVDLSGRERLLSKGVALKSILKFSDSKLENLYNLQETI